MRTSSLMLVAGLALSCSAIGHEGGAHGARTMDWSAPHITRTVALGTYTRSPVMLASRAASVRTETRAGRHCLAGGLFTFDVDDHFAFDIDEPVTLDLIIDTTASSGFVLLYDEATGSAGVRHVKSAPATGEALQTLTVTLDRARFGNRMRLHSDLVIAAPGSLFADPQGVWAGHEAEQEVVLCGLSLARQARQSAATPPTGRLVLSVRDESGQVTPARVGLYDAGARLPLPGPQALPIRIFDDTYLSLPLVEGWEAWPARGREVFYVNGDYTADVPAGEYELVVARGPEYRIAREVVRVDAGQTAQVTVHLQRWTDMRRRGWYSGDGHIHIARQRADDPDILAFMQAEDLHVANLLQMGTLTNAYFHQYGFGPAARYGNDRSVLVPGEETPRTMELGHHSGLNIRRYHHFDDYHRIDLYAREVGREGGLFGYMHVNLEFGGIERSMALGLPLGIGTHVEVLQAGLLNTRLLDDFLNLGFRAVPLSGSDFPYITLPGADRTYVHGGGESGADAWFAGLGRGNVFVTSGPMLELLVAGRGPGSDVPVAGGAPVKVSVTASVNPDVDRLERVELVVHGRVVATAHPVPGSDVIELVYVWQPGDSAWIAARAFGVNGTEALTGPVYVLVDGNPWFGDASQLRCLVRTYRAKLQELRELVPEYIRDPERRDYTREELTARWEAQRPGFEELITRAEAVYADLARRAPAGSCGDTAATP